VKGPREKLPGPHGSRARPGHPAPSAHSPRAGWLPGDACGGDGDRGEASGRPETNGRDRWCGHSRVRRRQGRRRPQGRRQRRGRRRRRCAGRLDGRAARRLVPTPGSALRGRPLVRSRPQPPPPARRRRSDPPAGVRVPRPGAVRRAAPQSPPRHPLFEYSPRYGPSPQIRRLSSVHILGTAELSRSHPQAVLFEDDPASSAACGSVDERSPQTVDDARLHRPGTELSTDHPQAAAGCPQRTPTSPHPCPLFGNAARLLTAASERRHTKVSGWAVGNVGKAGDGTGEKCPEAVHGVCRTFCSPQRHLVVHCPYPQGPWTKFGLRPGKTRLSTVSTGPTTTSD
jgi:hypothetical protein